MAAPSRSRRLPHIPGRHPASAVGRLASRSSGRVAAARFLAAGINILGAARVLWT
jgi:hypothetical protein